MLKTQLKIIALFAIVLFLLPDMLQAQGKAAARTKIDSLRWGFDYKSAEAYKRANQAKQLDSTYYVSHLIEGLHYYDKAEEHSGLQRAVAPIRKALNCFVADFGRVIPRRFSQDQIRQGAWKDILKQIDYLMLAGTLVECFQSLEQPDSTYAALIELKSRNMPFDFRSQQGLAWLYFRSRIYTSEKYPFLKASIEDNIATAFLYTDSLEAKYKKNLWYLRNQLLGTFPSDSPFYDFFKGAYIDQPKSYVSNTRGILYGYQLDQKKSVRFFKQMKGEENLAKIVNLGYAYHSDLDLRSSEDYFGNVPDLGTKGRGGHWQGYSTVFVFKNKPLEGVAKLFEERGESGFTIGYGWDNLCLARMQIYSGLLDEAELSLNKADKFTEVHFNTSFREDQYRFMLRTLRLLHHDYKLKAHRFEDRNRWFSLAWWRDAPRLGYLKYSGVYELANELALNPERENVYYHLFHSESIISFDELWTIIRNYNHGFFRKLFTRVSQNDPREGIDRYYQYFRGRLLQEEELYERAYNKLTEILSDPKLDKEYERLLIGRIQENLYNIAAEEEWEPQRLYHLVQLYQVYPQLIPFSNVIMGFRMTLSDELQNSNDPHLLRTFDQLRSCNIDLETNAEEYPELTLELDAEGRLMFQVVVLQDPFVRGSVDIKNEDAGKRLAYQLFKIQR
ncbi:MAG: hypothetical protein ACRBF0_10255 [Calditrichia bacterium]